MSEKLLPVAFFILFLSVIASIFIGVHQNEKAWNEYVHKQELKAGHKFLQAITHDEYLKLPLDSQKLYYHSECICH